MGASWLPRRQGPRNGGRLMLYWPVHFCYSTVLLYWQNVAAQKRQPALKGLFQGLLLFRPQLD